MVEPPVNGHTCHIEADVGFPIKPVVRHLKLIDQATTTNGGAAISPDLPIAISRNQMGRIVEGRLDHGGILAPSPLDEQLPL
jgi:hypothetical protein